MSGEGGRLRGFIAATRETAAAGVAQAIVFRRFATRLHLCGA
jgi:hypothetical protein